ncbi:hypothetical protein ABFA07_005141 [Porites harrisoni]
MAAEKHGLANIPCEDQKVEDDYIDELIRKYLYEEEVNSLYEDYHLPLLASHEVDKWPEATLPDFSCSQDFLVPELLQMENLSDDVEPQEELLSLLEEVITEDEKKNKGICETATGKDSSEEIAMKPDKIVTNSGPKPIIDETQSKKKRPRKTPGDKKAKRPCRSQPIIMKRRAKHRFIEE